jgi:hypothetical protein
MFGELSFVNQDAASKFIATQRKKDKEIATAFVTMVTEFRYTMDVLAQQPILVDTGQYQPKFQTRMFTDMENEISRDLTQQPNYQAKVKLLSGEYVIRTKTAPQGLADNQLAERIDYIKTLMAFPTVGYCRYYKHVEKGIRERQERWRGSGPGRRDLDEPPPTHT